MQLVFKKILCVVFPCLFFVAPLHPQPQDSAALNEAESNLYFSDIDHLHTIILDRLKQPGGDTARYFILDEVRNLCKNEYDCLQRTYSSVLNKLEGEFEHFAGILVAKEMVALAEQHKDIEAQASAIGRLSAIYGFTGDQKMRAFQQAKLWSLYERTGDIENALQTRFGILEGGVWYLGEAAETLPALEDILEQALEKGFTDLANRFRIRIKYVCEEHGFDDKFAEQVEALEKIPFSDPLQASEIHPAFHAASGRGDLLLKEKKYDQAKKQYLKALNIFQSRQTSHHDVWLQVYALFRLAKLEWERRDVSEAKKFLDEAYAIADETEMHDRAIMQLQMMTEIAEAEKNFEEAYRFTREIMSRQAILDSISGGFDMEKHQIQLQRDRLEVEKQNQTLELKLNKNMFLAMIVIVTLVALLALGLFIGLHKQRQGKRKISEQYDLIQQQTEQLKSLDAAKSRVFANISHELRTPLTLMLGPIKSLKKGNHPPQKQEQLLNLALQSGQQLQQLVNEILDLRKLEMGKMALNPKPTGICSFFNRYISQFESLAASNSIDFSFKSTIKNEVTALLDREKCRQVLHNLLSNAFKFTPAGGQVKVTLEMEKSENTGNGKPPAGTGNEFTNLPIYQFQLTVSDTGDGIHQDDLPHVFDRFYQTARPDATAQGGTGIGLALCHEYVQLFGGKMEVESRLGVGSTFRATFPLTLTESPAEAGAEPLESVPVFPSLVKLKNTASVKPAGDARPTILVVEDNPELQDYIRFILAEKYHVITAENGQVALELINGELKMEDGEFRRASLSSILHSPFLILSDLMMPVMDGYQLLEKLKGDDATRHIPVIMLTARAEARDKLKALRIGVDDYLTKPFDEEELLVRIENLLTNQAVREDMKQEEKSREKAQLEEVPGLSKEEEEWLEHFEAYVQDNLASDTLSVSFLAQEFAMSESTLLRQLKRLTGLSPKKYLQEVRLARALQMLEDHTNSSISNIATEIGYANIQSFSKSFKQRFGKSPSEMISD